MSEMGRIIKSLEQDFGLENVEEDDNFLDLGLDSLDILEFCFAMEDEFDSDFDHETVQPRTCKEILKLIHKEQGRS